MTDTGLIKDHSNDDPAQELAGDGQQTPSQTVKDSPFHNSMCHSLGTA